MTHAASLHPLPPISLSTIDSAELTLKLVRSCVASGDERGAVDYLERCRDMLDQELRLARKIRRAAR